LKGTPVSNLLSTIAWLTTQISLIATGIFALAWVIGSLLKGAPIPFRDIKEAGRGIQYDALKAAFELAIWSAISSLISWIAVAISSAM